jgi:hypothetical protein
LVINFEANSSGNNSLAGTTTDLGTTTTLTAAALAAYEINSFPITCQGLYDATHNLDGYTYHCDNCARIDWATYTAPVGSASHTAAMSEKFDFLKAKMVVGETIVLTRTFTKKYVGASSLADTFTSTVTLQVFAASTFCPTYVTFTPFLRAQYKGLTKVLKMGDAWTTTVENAIDAEYSSIYTDCKPATISATPAVLASSTYTVSLNNDYDYLNIYDYNSASTFTEKVYTQKPPLTSAGAILVTIDSSRVITIDSSGALVTSDKEDWGIRTFTINR